MSKFRGSITLSIFSLSTLSNYHYWQSPKTRYWRLVRPYQTGIPPARLLALVWAHNSDLLNSANLNWDFIYSKGFNNCYILLSNISQVLENTKFIAGDLSLIVCTDRREAKTTRGPVDLCSVPTGSQRPVDVGSEPTVAEWRAAAETKKIL